MQEGGARHGHGGQQAPNTHTKQKASPAAASSQTSQMAAGLSISTGGGSSDIGGRGCLLRLRVTMRRRGRGCLRLLVAPAGDEVTSNMPARARPATMPVQSVVAGLRRAQRAALRGGAQIAAYPIHESRTSRRGPHLGRAAAPPTESSVFELVRETIAGAASWKLVLRIIFG